MIKIILILGSLVLVAGGLAALLLKRGRRLKKDIKTARVTTIMIARRAENLVSLQSRQQRIREEAANEKTRLAKTKDSDLLNRANALFHKLPDDRQ